MATKPLAPVSKPVGIELVAHIPVKAPQVPGAAPAVQTKQVIKVPQAQDRELDQMLQDVTATVKNEFNEVKASKVSQVVSKIVPKSQAAGASQFRNTAVAATIVACLAAVALIAWAVISYRNGAFIEPTKNVIKAVMML